MRTRGSNLYRVTGLCLRVYPIKYKYDADLQSSSRDLELPWRLGKGRLRPVHQIGEIRPYEAGNHRRLKQFMEISPPSF